MTGHEYIDLIVIGYIAKLDGVKQSDTVTIDTHRTLIGGRMPVLHTPYGDFTREQLMQRDMSMSFIVTILLLVSVVSILIKKIKGKVLCQQAKNIQI